MVSEVCGYYIGTHNRIRTGLFLRDVRLELGLGLAGISIRIRVSVRATGCQLGVELGFGLGLGWCSAEGKIVARIRRNCLNLT